MLLISMVALGCKYGIYLMKTIHSGLVGIPQAAADAALYLASDEAKYITGIELNVVVF